MKSLVIAEKPSVARDIANALGKTKKQDNTYENDQYIISSTVGHIVELFMPEDIDKKFSYWRMDALPIIPEKFNLKPIQKTKTKFTELKKLIKRQDIDRIINACDAGREGELIFTYIYELAKSDKPVKRLWMQSMTKQAIQKAFSDLRDSTEMQPLQDAARCRSEADWLIGINGTRVFTKRIYGNRVGNVSTVGRVQTPTLSIVYEREQQIRNFQPRNYWQIIANFTLDQGEYQGILQRSDWKKNKQDEHDRVDRIWDKATADEIYAQLQKNTNAQVSDQKRRNKQIAPQFYDLTSLQREANNRYSFPAAKTLRVAQALYEAHKMITYPRTDARVLPEDYIPTCNNVLNTLTNDLKTHAQTILGNHWVKPNKRLFNNAQVSDHFAIIPTGENKKLSPDEIKIYDMIARRFVAAFFPPAEYDVTTRTSITPNNYTFKTEGKILAKPGWLAVYGKNTNTKKDLPPITPADGTPPTAKIKSLHFLEDQTKPPPRYTEATLLRAMETAGKFVENEELAQAMKEKGLGTPATRSGIIDHLINQKYMERQARELIPIAKAENLFNFLNATQIEVLASPAMTGEWEYKLRQVQEGKLSRKEFIKAIVGLTTDIVERAKNFKQEEQETQVPHIISPTDDKPVLKTFNSYKTQDGSITIYKTIANRILSEQEIATLITNRTVGPFDNFISKRGTPFSATLYLDQDNKVKFSFANDNQKTESNETNQEPLDISTLPQLGQCPSCSSKILEAPNSYACQNNLDGSKKCNFRIARNMLGKTLPIEQIKKLIEHKQTDLIEGFCSKRTKKFFNAFLILKKNGTISFKFPPRTPKK
jgi:DNA topoisomerase III